MTWLFIDPQRTAFYPFEDKPSDTQGKAMKSLATALIAATLSLAATGAAFPEAYRISQNEFLFAPGQIGFSGLSDMVWDPKRPSTNPVPFLYMSGDAAPGSACAAVSNCSQAGDRSCFVQDATPGLSKSLTGLDTPLVVAPQCSRDQGVAALGKSFFGYGRGRGTDGVSMYTYTGPDADSGIYPMLQPSKTGTGTPDFDIQGNYLHLYTENARNPMRPFMAAARCNGGKDWQACADAATLTAITWQQVGATQDNGCSQQQQTLRLTLRNMAGGHEHRVGYAFRSFCQGVGCPPDNIALLQSDPNQGGFNYIAGNYIPGGGELRAHDDYGSNVPRTMFRSVGPAGTQSRPGAGSQRFEARISWAEFTRGLRLLTYRGGGDGQNYQDVAARFGPDWDQPGNWRLRLVAFGQEVFNPNWDGSAKSCSSPVASIGGNVRLIRLLGQAQ